MQEVSSGTKKRKIKLDLGMIVFLCIIVYIVAWNIIYLSKDKITYYEVVPGEMVESDRFKAMILCDDKIVKASDDGMVYFLARSGSKASTASVVYCLDKTSNLENIISDTSSEQILSDEERMDIYDELKNLSASINEVDFSDVYQFKSTTSAILMNALSSSVFDSGDYAGALQLVNPSEAGYIYYFEDGYEGVDKDSFTPEMLQYDDYNFKTLNNEGYFSAGASVYKLITDENWDIIFKLNDYQYDKYIQDEYVQVKFLKDNQIVWGQIDLLEIGEDIYCSINFTNSMVRYASSRYTDVEIIFSSETGLKVPNSSIVVKEFYTIPKDYGEASGGILTVNIHSVDDEGQPVIKAKDLEIYEETDKYYMISINDLDEGTNIIQDTTGNIYTVSEKEPIK